MAEEGGEWLEAWRGTGTVAKVGDLAAGRHYSFRVAASSAVGEGLFSRPTAARTLLHPPQPPHSLLLQPTQECAPDVHDKVITKLYTDHHPWPAFHS